MKMYHAANKRIGNDYYFRKRVGEFVGWVSKPNAARRESHKIVQEELYGAGRNEFYELEEAVARGLIRKLPEWY